MKRNCLAVLALLVAVCMHAQTATRVVDSLLTVFDRQRSVQTANRLFNIFNDEELSDEQLHATANTHPDTLKQQVWYWAAEYYLAHQNYEQSVAYGLKALPLSVQSTDIEGDCLTAVAISYFRMGDFEHAISYAKRCNELDQRVGNPDNISSSFNLMTAIFVSARQYDEAEKCILRGLDFCQKANNPQRRAILLGMACEVYNNKGQYDVALPYAEQALALEQKLQRSEKIAVRQSQMAESLMGLDRFSEARQLLLQCIPGLRQNGNRHSLGIACNQMGRLLLHDGDNSGAALYFDEALQIFLDQKDIFNESRSRRGLYEALRQTDPEQAMAHNDRYNQLRDSIFDNETGMMLSQYSAQLDNEHLQAEKDELRNQHRRNLYLAFAVVVILAVATWVFSYRRQHRYQRRMTELTDEITRIHQQVADIKLAAEPKKPDFTDQQFLIDVITNVNEAMQQGTFSVESIAGKMSLSPATLRRRLQQVTGEKPKAYFTAIQMQKAVSLLQQGSLSVNEVAEKCGFIDPSSFTRTFKRIYGVAPTQYQPAEAAQETEEQQSEES